MKLTFRSAMGFFAVLLVVSLATLQGKILMATIAVICGLALKTWIGHLRMNFERREAAQKNQD